jgi:hypothetical protein
MLVKINTVVDLAAALADEGQSHAIQESQAAADIGGGFTAREVPGGRCGQRNFLDDIGRTRTR